MYHLSEKSGKNYFFINSWRIFFLDYHGLKSITVGPGFFLISTAGIIRKGPIDAVSFLLSRPSTFYLYYGLVGPNPESQSDKISKNGKNAKITLIWWGLFYFIILGQIPTKPKNLVLSNSLELGAWPPGLIIGTMLAGASPGAQGTALRGLAPLAGSAASSLVGTGTN